MNIAKTKTQLNEFISTHFTLQSCIDLLKRNIFVQGTVICTSLYFLRQFGYYLYRKYHHLPPGPNGIPLFGCAISFKRDAKWLIRMTQKYGSVISFPLLGSMWVCISDSVIIKQLFIKKECMYRGTMWYKISQMKHYQSIFSVGENENTLPIIWTDADTGWNQRRKHAQNALFRTMSSEYVGDILSLSIANELEPYLTECMQHKQAWHPRKLCQYLAFNTLFHSMFGYQIKRDSALYLELIHDFEATFELLLKDKIAFKYSFYRPEILRFTRKRRNENIRNLIRERIKNNVHKQKQTYIDHMHQLVIDGAMTENEVIADTYFIFLAGQDTTSSTLDFGIVLIAKHAEIQSKIRNELLSVFKDNVFGLKYVNNCPLFRAMVHEILRLSCVAYIGVRHSANYEDQWIVVGDNKYRIPADTLIYTNMDYIHNCSDNEQWKKKEGDKICLENWLADDGRFEMNPSFVVFGAGRRDCVGRQLAMKEIYCILAYLVMNYKLRLNEPIENILDYKKGNLGTVFMSPSVGVHIEKYNS